MGLLFSNIPHKLCSKQILHCSAGVRLSRKNQWVAHGHFKKRNSIQRAGTTRNKTSHPDISQESKRYFNSRTNEQHSGFDIFEKNWGNQESEIDHTVKRDLGNINFRTDYDCCGVPT